MTEQEINHHFGCIRTFIEQTLHVNANPRRTSAIATTIIRLENLHDKMLELARATARRQQPRIITKLAA